MSQEANENEQVHRSGSRRPRWMNRPRRKPASAAPEAAEKNPAEKAEPSAPKAPARGQGRSGRFHSSRRQGNRPDERQEKKNLPASSEQQPRRTAASAPRAEQPHAPERQAAAVKAEPARPAQEQARHTQPERRQEEEPRRVQPEVRQPAHAAADDAGPILITRRPPAQKYASFEEYVKAHEGFHVPDDDGAAE